MALSLVSFLKPKVPRLVRVFFSDSRIIVVPMENTPTGVYYEQSTPIVLPVPCSPTDLGTAFHQAFDGFKQTGRDLAGVRRSDWPAFHASGLRSMKAFERAYLPMVCESLNLSDAVVRASVAHPTEAGLELSTSFNPFLAPEKIGASLFQLANAARAGQ